MHAHPPSHYPPGYPKMSTWSPGDVLLAFLFALIFGAVLFFTTLLGQPQ